MTDQTRGIVNADALAKCKKGVFIINCARGGLVIEADLQAALESGQVAGAGLDVFAEEPAKQHPLFGNEKIICTPHLGASTNEAQENVALQVAEQMSDFLLTGAVTNALNMPSISADDAPKLRPYLALSGQLGAFAGQIADSSISSVTIEYEGEIAKLNTRPLTNMIVMGLLHPSLESINMVNAPVVAKERGIKISEIRSEESRDYHTLIRITITGASTKFSLAGTLFSGKPRLVAVDNVLLEAELTPNMLFVRNQDKPGFIGRLGTLLGEAKINIANFMLGRSAPDADAVCLVSVDGEIPTVIENTVKKMTGVVSAYRLKFEA